MNGATESIATHVKELNQDERKALRNIRTFALFSMVGYSVGLVLLFGVIASYGVILKDEYAGNHGYAFLTPGLISMAELLIAYTIIQLISAVYLRSGYGLLKGTVGRFRSPHTGVSLYIVGTIVEVIFGIVIVGAELRGFLHVVDGFDTQFWLILFFDIAISFAGVILGLAMGSFRLKAYFSKPNFGYAGVLFVLALFFSLFGIIGAMLVYRGVNSLLEDRST